MKLDGIEEPIGLVVARPRRRGDRVRIAAVGLVAIAVLVGGVGLAGNGPTGADQTRATSSPGAAATTRDRSSPVAPAPTIADPTSGCGPLTSGTPSETTLSGSSGGVHGVSNPTPSIDTQPTWSTWPRPADSAALLVDRSAVLSIGADDNACMRYVVAEYAPSDPAVKGPFPFGFRTVDVLLPTSNVTLGVLPDGDWVVHVVAYFSAGAAVQVAGAAIDRYFRVIVGISGLLPAPEISPAVPCVSLARGATPVLVLTGSSSGSVRGTTGPTQEATLVRLGDAIEIRTEGDACAIKWSIQAFASNAPLDPFEIESVTNPGNNPVLFSQNRWTIQYLPMGTVRLMATMFFSRDVFVTAEWQLEVTAPSLPLPAVRVAAPGGKTVTAVASRCNASWQFAAGTSGWDTCETDVIPTPLAGMAVPAGTPLTVEVPGWRIDSWSAECGQSFPTFVPINGCGLGGWSRADGQASLKAVFLPRASGPQVQIWITVSRDGVTVGQRVFVLIEISP